MAYCELCDMDREFCEHGLAERRRNSIATIRELLISPSGMAHFPGCPHKGDDPDYRRWASLETPRAWERLGNGEQLEATGGEFPSLLARTRCQDCVDALGVLGLGSLLLTQVRYEHSASIKDAEAQELATREAADMRRADSASAQLIRDGLDGLPADPTGLN